MVGEFQAILREVYDLYGSKPQEAVSKLLKLSCENIQWCTNANESMSGLRFAKNRGSRDDVAQYFEDVLKDWEPQGIEIFHFTEQDGRVYVSGRGTWKNLETSKVVSTNKVDFYRFENGALVEFQEFFDTATVMNAALSDS